MSEIAVRFADRLRAAGLDVPPDTVLTYTRALDAVGVTDADAVYWAGRATLVRRPEDIPVYDAVFSGSWGEEPPQPRTIVQRVEGEEGEDGDEGGDGEPGWQYKEILRTKDLADLDDDERAEADRLLDALRLAGPVRRSRRRRPNRHRGSLDLRRTVAAALRAGGEPVRLAREAPGRRRRRVVLLVDVSGSMADYGRALLRFAHAAVAARSGVEVFGLGTRLTRLTPALTTHDADAALRAASAAILDYEGGTRLGETLAEFNDRYGIRGLARGAVVVILSDGWDRGDTDLLGEQVARLSRVAHRLVWVNPLKASAGYEPLAAGMAAALPHLDEFVEGESVASLERLAAVVAGTNVRSHVGPVADVAPHIRREVAQA